MKKIGMAVVIIGTLCVIFSCAGSNAPKPAATVIPGESNPAIENMLNNYAARDFVAGEIDQSCIDRILECGVKSPSARNNQGWHFTVVRSADVSKKIIPNMPEGNILIIISIPEQRNQNTAAVLDGGLATENIYLAALALGLGSRIYTGPVGAANNIKGELGFPASYEALAVVRIGQVKSVTDGISGASSRKDMDSIVNYK